MPEATKTREIERCRQVMSVSRDELRGMRVSEAVEAFIFSREAEGKMPETVRTYRERLGVLQRWLGDDPAISTLTADRMRRYFHYLLHEHVNRRNGGRLGAETVADSWRSLHAFFAWLVTEEAASKNPMDRIERPKVPPRPVPALDEITMRKVADYWTPFRTPKGYSTKHLGINRHRFLAVRNRAYVLLSLTAALRRGEVIGVNVDSFDWANRRVTVKGKGGKVRQVPISKPAARALAVYVKERERWARGRRTVRIDERGEPFFVTLEGKRITKAAVRFLVARIKKDLGLKRLSPHIFRHTGLTLLRRGGLDLFQLQAISGHANLNSLRPYQLVTPEELSTAIDSVDSLNRLDG